MLIPISDLDDLRVAAYRWVADPRRLEDEGLFVAEGRLVVPRLLDLSAGAGRWAGAAQSVLLSPAACEHMQAVISRHPAVPTYIAPQAVMDGLVGFNMHRGCLALARRPAPRVFTAESLDSVRQIVVLEGVNNPDNIGGIFRSAAAFGTDLVVLGPTCGDPLYRKAVRTSMGATLEVPYVAAPQWPEALDVLRAYGCEVVALTTNSGAEPLSRLVPHAARVAVLAGAEGTGLTEQALARAHRRVTIPMSGRVDSLNVATAVSIALYHVGVSGRP